MPGDLPSHGGRIISRRKHSTCGIGSSVADIEQPLGIEPGHAVGNKAVADGLARV